MKTKNARTRKASTMVAGAAVIGLLVSACATGGGGESDPEATDGGVPYGASLEEYQAAFADVEPISLRIQGPGPEGFLGQAGMQAWADAVEEWSDEKITFEWGYGNSFVPAATEWTTGMADGRLDAGYVLPYYTPEVFPMLTDLNDATFLDGNKPTGTLISTGWITDVMYSSEEIQQEAADNGLHILLLPPSANYSGIFCSQERTTLGELNGATVSAAGLRAAQVEGLGMSPQSIAFSELYEALERNVLNCGTTTTGSLDTLGATTLVPYAMMDPEASLVGFTNYFAVGKERWDSMPLVAKQLLFDKLEVLLETEPVAQAQRSLGWLDQIQSVGGGILPLADDARERLLEVNTGLLDEMTDRGADTDAFLAAHDRWAKLIDDELYPDATESLQEFLGAGAFNDWDLKPFAQTVFEEILLPNRPS